MREKQKPAFGDVALVVTPNFRCMAFMGEDGEWRFRYRPERKITEVISFELVNSGLREAKG